MQRLWELWCEGAETYLHERAQQVPGKKKKAQFRRQKKVCHGRPCGKGICSPERHHPRLSSECALKITTALWRGLIVHASAVRIRDSEGRAVESSSVLVTTGIALSLCLGVSKPTIWRQSLRCECKTETLRIRSDSENVARIATGVLRGERQLNNEGNADLCDEFVTELRLKTTRQLNFVWVKGRVTKVHIDREITTNLCAADALASAAAAHHAAPQALTEAATKRQRIALSTHLFAADPLKKLRDTLLSMSGVDHG